LTGFNFFNSIIVITSVVSYANADTQKESVLEDNKGKAGIYCWTNKINGKKYVGSSVDLYRRFMQYYNIKYLTRASEFSLICKALLKHGYSNFQLEILEYCDPSEVILREQYYIDLLNPEYNILKVAGSSFGYKHTIESLKKMSDIAKNRSEETKAKWREAALGRIHSEETKAKLREIALNRLKHPVEGKKNSS
jgi:group I intron endonuclease